MQSAAMRYGVGIHPQSQMKKLGITYKQSIPQSICDQWWFGECENIPNPLPGYLDELSQSAMDDYS